MRISDCTYDYLQVQYNPFEPALKAAPCLPDIKAFPSHKFMLRKRLTMVSATVTAGGTLAAIAFNPSTIDNSTTGSAAPIPMACSTNGTTVATDVLEPATATGWVETFWDSEYAGGFTDNNDNTFRTVGAGVRIQYAGAWDACAGTVAVFKHPRNQPINGTTDNFDKLLEYDDTGYSPLENGKPYQCVYHPTQNGDFNYGLSVTTRMGSMVIAVKGAPAGAIFTVDVIGWFEGIGEDFSGMTPSHSDPAGLGKVMSLSKKQSAGSGVVADVAYGILKAFGSGAKKYVYESAKSMGSSAAAGAASYGSSALWWLQAAVMGATGG